MGEWPARGKAWVFATGEVLHIIIPTLNAAKNWNSLSSALLTCVSPEQVLIVDSQSTDGTAELAQAAGFRVHSITRSEFSHGNTRRVAAEMLPSSEILIYMTQDAVPADAQSIANLVRALDDDTVAAAYGRQLPRAGAGAIESHARLFNYPETSHVRDFHSRTTLGIKTPFISNSFAVYRRSALMRAGGFARNLNFGEDTTAAAKLLLAGDRIAYVAEALVFHSHSYTCLQEFRRYFDIGVLHVREKQLFDEFGNAEGEGKKFVQSEVRYLLEKDPVHIPLALLRTGLKLLGYRLGKLEAFLPLLLKARFSTDASFWQTQAPLGSR